MSEDAAYERTAGAVFCRILLIVAGAFWMLCDFVGKGTSCEESANHWIAAYATTWGWIQLPGGIIGPAAGFGGFSGAA